MSRILIFSGTTEGRRLAETLSRSFGQEENAPELVVSVATEYGEIVMPNLPHVELHKGRMDENAMEIFIKENSFDFVVDATHPYATKVSQIIKETTEKNKTEYLRLRRNTKDVTIDGDVKYFSSCEECAKELEAIPGNVLLTTGSKDLGTYAQNDDLRARLYVRVLPCAQSFALCEEAGVVGKQIIAMQGPFSQQMNEILLKEYEISCLVTKESGQAGGFREKVEAAKKLGIPTFVIGNPEQENEGLSFHEVCIELSQKLGLTIPNQVDLVGIGMGTEDILTMRTKKIIEHADYIFGAQRLLDSVKAKGVKYPYYLAKDIFPKLDELTNLGKNIAILFSGDTGFYSGCTKLYEEIKKRRDCLVTISPGISSVSYMASRVGVSYQDACITSIHGHGQDEKWKKQLLHCIKNNEKTFVLMSGVEDVKLLGELLVQEGFHEARIYVGYQLSYPNETIISCTPKECCELVDEGLYICVVCHEKTIQQAKVSPSLKDDAFIRDKVPMTKEEIRHISICKLGLESDSVVYDIGSGTGSIAIEMAKLSPRIQVYALEKKSEAVELISLNKNKFKVSNLEIVEGEATKTLAALPKATHAFIGGSGGNLEKIIDTLYEKNSAMKVVVNGVSLETIAKLAELKKDERIVNLELSTVQVSKTKTLGGYQMLQAQNPVVIGSFEFRG